MQFAGLYNAARSRGPVHPPIRSRWVRRRWRSSEPERGVFRRPTGEDGGRCCSSRGVGDEDVEFNRAIHVVYAWMSRLERKPWTIISGSRDGGFYKSTDGGENFSRITAGLPGDLIGKANLAVTNAKPDRLYALIEAKPGGGFYRSDDAGQTWAS